MASLWRFQSKGWLGTTAESDFFGLYARWRWFFKVLTFYPQSITQCKWQKWVVNPYFYWQSLMVGDMPLCLSGWRASTSRMTSPRPGWSSWQPSPPTLTYTWPRWEIIMCLPHQPIKPWPTWPPWPSQTQRIIEKINALFNLSCFKHSLECTAFALCPRCPETAGTYRTKSSPGFTLATSESIS